jgi:hypothetical protein
VDEMLEFWTPGCGAIFACDEEISFKVKIGKFFS